MKKTNILVGSDTMFLLKKLEANEKKTRPQYARVITHDFVIFKMAVHECNRQGLGRIYKEAKK